MSTSRGRKLLLLLLKHGFFLFGFFDQVVFLGHSTSAVRKCRSRTSKLNILTMEVADVVDDCRGCLFTSIRGSSEQTRRTSRVCDGDVCAEFEEQLPGDLTWGTELAGKKKHGVSVRSLLFDELSDEFFI